MNQYREALLESMKHDLSRHQVKIYGNGSLPDGIHYYLKSLEEMTGEFLINSFLKAHQEWRECCREDELFQETLEDFISDFKFWRMKQISTEQNNLIDSK